MYTTKTILWKVNTINPKFIWNLLFCTNFGPKVTKFSDDEAIKICDQQMTCLEDYYISRSGCFEYVYVFTFMSIT
jgi:hypothetical protein